MDRVAVPPEGKESAQVAPITFGTANIPSLKAQTDLLRATSALSKTFERLSSGLRINSASDDPAGLALADELRADSRLASVALRNANDGVSIASVVDGALQEIGTILERMAELAGQSANGSYTNTQRSALASEFLALGSEIERIAITTTFNNINLLSGSSSITLQVGFTGGGTSQISMQSVVGTLTSLGLATAGGSQMSFSIVASTTLGSEQASAVTYSAIRTAINTLSTRRGTVGAAESRLNSAINYLTAARENFLAAESRIRDADIAQEVANMVRLQIIQNSAQAIIAQANQQPSLVLRLLG